LRKTRREGEETAWACRNGVAAVRGRKGLGTRPMRCGSGRRRGHHKKFQILGRRGSLCKGSQGLVSQYKIIGLHTMIPVPRNNCNNATLSRLCLQYITSYGLSGPYSAYCPLLCTLSPIHARESPDGGEDRVSGPKDPRVTVCDAKWGKMRNDLSCNDKLTAIKEGKLEEKCEMD
jgi:hypothetical protein